MNGLVVIGAIVVLGLGSGAGYLAYKRPRLERQRDAILAAAPTTAEGRLRRWFEFGVPQIHHRLTSFARFSAEHPWIVTHRIAGTDGRPDTIWGVPCDEIGQDLAHIEGLTVVVELPPPRALGAFELDRDQARYVPRYASPDLAPDPDARLTELAAFFLERLPVALSHEIPGAKIEVRVVHADAPSG